MTLRLAVDRARRALAALAFASLLALGWGGARPALAGSPEARSATAVDAAGALEDTPEPPAGWLTLVGPQLRVHTHPDDVAVARRLLRHGEDSVPRIARALGVGSGGDIHVFLAPDDVTFEAIQPGPTPPWADGLAWPSRGLVYLHAPSARIGTDEPLEQVMDHELVHVVLGRAFAPRPVPTWLQEGAAQTLSGQSALGRGDDLAFGMLSGGLLPLRELTRGFPADATRARTAYAQSALFVSYLSGAAGDQGLRRVVQRMAAGDTVEQAVLVATGKDLDSLDAAWRDRLSGSVLWLKPLFSDEAILGLGSALLVIGGTFALRRKKLRARRWADEERVAEALRDAVSEWPGRPPLRRSARVQRRPLFQVDGRWDHPTPGVG